MHVVLGGLGIGGIWVAVWQGNKVGEALQGIRADIRTLATSRAYKHSRPVPGQDPGHPAKPPATLGRLPSVLNGAASLGHGE